MCLAPWCSAAAPAAPSSADAGDDALVAMAAEPDWQARWSNSVRYSVGQRLRSRNPLIADNALYDQGDALFDRHHLVTNRLDLLSEAELVYRGRQGLRVSAAAWYDAAYGVRGRRNPGALGATASPPSYGSDRFSPYVRRYYAGPGAELLDGFVFGALAWGSSVWNLKLGRHAVVWGEALFSTTHAIAYAQAPSDGMKLAANPGASAKETALPSSQLSLLAQLDPAWALVAQWGLEWRPSRVAEGGTYFGVDGVNQGPTVNRLPALAGAAGDVGAGIQWRPASMGGLWGLYVRRFDDKAGWLAQAAGAGQTRAVYGKGISLVGVSYSGNVGASAIGLELSHRRDAPLVSDSAASAGPAHRDEGARGDTWHGVVNASRNFGPGLVSDASSLAVELAWARLDRVTRHPELYRAAGYLPACNTSATMKGCADRIFSSLTLSFVPVWYQVQPGIDLELPVFYARNWRGNAPTNGGGSQAAASYRVGLSFKAFARHQVDLAYLGYSQRVERAADSVFGSRVLGAPLQDKGWLSLTCQTVF